MTDAYRRTTELRTLVSHFAFLKRKNFQGNHPPWRGVLRRAYTKTPIAILPYTHIFTGL
jgi:hypothetical protein